METSSLNVVIVPTPGMGHLIPLFELAKRLVHNHNFSITFIVPSDGSPMKSQKKLLQSLSQNKISSIFLPPVSFDDLPPDAKIEARITLSLTRSLGVFRDSFKKLCESTRVVALVVDVFGTEAFDVGAEFGVPPYIFIATTGMSLSFMLEFPKLDAMYSCEFRDLPEPVHLPGCVPVRGIDLCDVVQDRKNEVYRWSLRICNQYRLAAGILVNSSMNIEPGVFKALMEVKPGLPPIYPVGPLTQTRESSSGDDRSGCLEWLDNQPKGSVLFVSFGSGGTLSGDQIKELAFGLEMSGQRFLWVVRPPNDKHDEHLTCTKSNENDKYGPT
ncbi:hypothetical protein HS088_TW15G00262 [Tripterygium wilfordii]|uniref:Hydroquinone glucosyltransferase-like n=1 Tax=Tripterygium wilfordii TaxID=458696 RepID=A0A7J7CL37_TRIWF|nr:hypothetical protein HS088_TW15G00262 [Tripterygium wilfordii]